MELPLKMRCRTIDSDYFVVNPHFGNCQATVLDEKQVTKTIKMQHRFLQNLDFFLEKSKDPAGLLKCPAFV